MERKVQQRWCAPAAAAPNLMALLVATLVVRDGGTADVSKVYKVTFQVDLMNMD